jgi:flagellar hook protein FlgE
MSFALSAGVSGLQAHQRMLDVAGNNLANVNTTAFKASRIEFSELLSETIKKASQPTTSVGGTNPQQLGSGVGIAGIAPNMTQGNLVNTGNPLDLAIEGEGYFVLSDGSQNIYSRAGAFAVDANSTLVDPATGYRVQRIGSGGESDGFQIPGNSDIHVPYDVAMAAKATSQITVAGNLSAKGVLPVMQTQSLTSNIAYTVDGTGAELTTKLKDLDQFTGTMTTGTLTAAGFDHDGNALSSGLTLNVDTTTTLDDVLTWLNTDNGVAPVSEVQTATLATAPDNVPDGGTFTLTYGGETTGNIAWNASANDIETALEALPNVNPGDITVSGSIASGVTFTFKNTLGDTGLITLNSSLTDGGTAVTGTFAETTKGAAATGVLGGNATASLVNGKICVTDTESGYSKSDLALTYTGASDDEVLEMPSYFEMTSVGGNEVKSISLTVYDTQGGTHVLSGAFVRTDTANTWDMILSSVTGDVQNIDMANRRISGITFDPSDGSFTGLNGSAASQFVVSFEHDPANPQTIDILMGTAGKLDGLTQFAANSTAVARGQDGYEAGRLSAVSIDKEGVVIGAFSNGIKKNIANLQIALFQNPAALESIGSGYYSPSANSGEAVATQALSGGAGSIHGGALEKSNTDVASEFVNMINAQSGFQANARTIKVADEILTELTRLIS